MKSYIDYSDDWKKLRFDIIDPLEAAQLRPKKVREYLRNLSTTEKIRVLEESQRSYYELYLIREKNTGRPIPEGWKRWARAQEAIKK